MPEPMAIRWCPRCENRYSAPTAAEAMALVREHLVRAQGADLDEGLHDNALELWDSTDG